MIRRAASAGVGALLAATALAGCGTGSFDNTYSVTVTDPSGRLGDRGDPVQVALFDPVASGIPEYRNEDAGQIGTSAPGAPYTTSIPVVATKMVGDSGPVTRLQVGLYLPQLHDDAYYGVAWEPVDGQTVELDAPFVSFDAGYEPIGQKPRTGPPVPVRVTPIADGSSWRVTMDVTIPPKP